MRFFRAGNQVWSYDTVFVQGNTRQNPGLLHPYAIVLGPDHDLYVSSQDTGLVSRFAEPTAHSPGAPRPTIIDGFPSGTFISPQNGAFQTGKYPIRGITFDAVGALYVANEKRNEIEVYDHAGAVLPSIISAEDVKIDRPVQVRFDAEGTLYISSAGNNAVLSYADNTLAALIGRHGAHLDAVSGIDVDANGHLYVGSRKAKYVLRYALPDTQPKMLLSDLDHKPEFVTIL